MEPGTRVGIYEIAARIGEGGMGEVYRARDTTLDRDVALKILPESFASDRDRLMRFEREAKSLAVLNHPNIAQVYGVAQRAIAMELVEGEIDRLGSLETGKLADLVVLGADPLQDIANTRAVELVVQSGKVYRPEELLARHR